MYSAQFLKIMASSLLKMTLFSLLFKILEATEYFDAMCYIITQRTFCHFLSTRLFGCHLVEWLDMLTGQSPGCSARELKGINM